MTFISTYICLRFPCFPLNVLLYLLRSTACFLLRVDRYLDFVSVMTYDLHGEWDNEVGHSSALYPAANDTGDNLFLNVVRSNKHRFPISFHCSKNALLSPS